MARQARDERRRRRAQSEASIERARPQVRPGVQPAPTQVPEPRRGHFLAESWAELQKVEWPRQHQVIAGTVVVLVACLVVGFYLWGADQVFKPFVQHVLLR